MPSSLPFQQCNPAPSDNKPLIPHPLCPHHAHPPQHLPSCRWAFPHCLPFGPTSMPTHIALPFLAPLLSNYTPQRHTPLHHTFTLIPLQILATLLRDYTPQQHTPMRHCFPTPQMLLSHQPLTLLSDSQTPCCPSSHQNLPHCGTTPLAPPTRPLPILHRLPSF